MTSVENRVITDVTGQDEVILVAVTQSCDFATPWTVASHASLSMEFSRQEHWSGLPFPSPMHENEK